MTLYCAGGCRTRLGHVVVHADGGATFYFNDVPRYWDRDRLAFVCGDCLPGPEVAEAA